MMSPVISHLFVVNFIILIHSLITQGKFRTWNLEYCIIEWLLISRLFRFSFFDVNSIKFRGHWCIMLRIWLKNFPRFQPFFRVCVSVAWSITIDSLFLVTSWRVRLWFRSAVILFGKSSQNIPNLLWKKKRWNMSHV